MRSSGAEALILAAGRAGNAVNAIAQRTSFALQPLVLTACHKLLALASVEVDDPELAEAKALLAN